MHQCKDFYVLQLFLHEATLRIMAGASPERTLQLYERNLHSHRQQLHSHDGQFASADYYNRL